MSATAKARPLFDPPIVRRALLESLRKLVPTTTKQPAKLQSAAWIARTALCAEPRGGRLYLFMPPVAALEDYLEIVAAIEATAHSQGMPVILEGYEPPRDARLNARPQRRLRLDREPSADKSQPLAHADQPEPGPPLRGPDVEPRAGVVNA